MTVLLIGAHPDDEMSAGGTLLKHSRAGDRVVIVTMTRGGMGHRTMPQDELIALRTREAEAAAEALGAELRMLDYPDGGVPMDRDTAVELARHIRDVRPDVVLTHSDETFHPDHRATHQLVIDAVFHASLPLLDLGLEDYKVPRLLEFSNTLFRRHDVYVDITEVMDDTIEAAACHASQYSDWLVSGGSAIDTRTSAGFREEFRREARALGAHCGVEYAEAFNHVMPVRPRPLDRLAP